MSTIIDDIHACAIARCGLVPTADEVAIVSAYIRSLESELGALKQPVAGDRGFNGCLSTAAEALRFLADNERPVGGEQEFNSAHLFQMSEELGRTADIHRAALRDAERYRWLRGEFGRHMLESFFCAYDAKDWIEVDQKLDCAIDAAIQKEKGNG